MKKELLEKIAELRSATVSEIKTELDTLYKAEIEKRLAEILAKSDNYNAADGVVIRDALTNGIADAIVIEDKEVDYKEVEEFVDEEITKIQEEASKEAVETALPAEIKDVLLVNGKVDEAVVETIKQNLEISKKQSEFVKFKESKLFTSLGEDAKDLTIEDYEEIVGSISEKILEGVLDGSIESNKVLESAITKKVEEPAEPEGEEDDDTPFKQATNGMTQEEADNLSKDLEDAAADIIRDVTRDEEGNYIDPKSGEKFTEEAYKEIIKEEILKKSNPE